MESSCAPQFQQAHSVQLILSPQGLTKGPVFDVPTLAGDNSHMMPGCPGPNGVYRNFQPLLTCLSPKGEHVTLQGCYSRNWPFGSMTLNHSPHPGCALIGSVQSGVFWFGCWRTFPTKTKTLTPSEPRSFLLFLPFLHLNCFPSSSREKNPGISKLCFLFLRKLSLTLKCWRVYTASRGEFKVV